MTPEQIRRIIDELQRARDRLDINDRLWVASVLREKGLTVMAGALINGDDDRGRLPFAPSNDELDRLTDGE
jgi:hypothetical protein